MDLLQAWTKLDRKRARVKRVMGSLASVTFADGTEPATFRLPPGVLLAVGAEINVAGDASFHGRLRVLAIEHAGQRTWVDRELAMKKLLPPAPSVALGPPSFLPILVEYGLLDDVSQVDPALYHHDAQTLLVSLYAPRAAIDRGFVHWDHRWKNDTNDPIADLAQIVQCPELHAIHIGTTFRFAFDALALDVVHADDLESVGDAIDRWLARDLMRVRLFSWVTGDRHVFLARPLERGLALAKALGDTDLVPASAEPEYEPL